MKNADKQIILSGLPRSGTSVTAGIASILGVDLGNNLDKVINPEFHPTGIYEDTDISNFNHRIVSLFPEYEHKGPVVVETTGELIESVRDFVSRRYEGKPLWGCKDPRISFMLDLWAAALPNPHFILTLREREDYIATIRKYAVKVTDTEAYVNAAIDLYMRQVELLKKRGTPHLFVHFSKLLANPMPTAKKMATFIGVNWTKAKERAIRSFVIQR